MSLPRGFPGVAPEEEPEPQGRWDSAPAEHEEELNALVVDVGGVTCGIPVVDVLEVHAMVETVPLPGAPLGIDGAIDVRGSVVAVVDVRTRFGLPGRKPLLGDHLVLTRVGAGTAALRVDRALDFAAVPCRLIDSTAHLFVPGHLRGVGRLPGGLVLIHDVSAFFSHDEGAAIDQALDRAGMAGR